MSKSISQKIDLKRKKKVMAAWIEYSQKRKSEKKKLM